MLLPIVFLVANTLVNGNVVLVETPESEQVNNNYCEISPDPKILRPSQCCVVGDILPVEFKEEFKTCETIYPFTYHVPEGYDQDPWTLWVHHTSCLDECIFSKLKVLTKSKKINQMALRAAFTNDIEEPVLKAVNDALDNCFVIYKHELEDDDANDDLECKSGATELLGCYMREVFLNCPEELWKGVVDGDQCSDLWDKVNSCPKIHVMLHNNLADIPPTKRIPTEDIEE